MKVNSQGVRFSARLALLIMIWFYACAAGAQTTGTLSDAEIQGQQLVQAILGQPTQQPLGSSTNTGVLRIKDGKDRSEISIECITVFTPTNWQTVYQASFTNKTEILWVIHADGQNNSYYYVTNYPVPLSGDIPVWGDLFHGRPRLAETEIWSSFAGSDFWLSDLGLEFFHWPGQKVIKRETHRSCGCTVLESTNPDPGSSGYSRVVSWIDNDTLGIVEAYAYDAGGQKLKDFYPKDFKKVDGHWQVQTLEMENVETGFRSRMEFDLKK